MIFLKFFLNCIFQIGHKIKINCDVKQKLTLRSSWSLFFPSLDPNSKCNVQWSKKKSCTLSFHYSKCNTFSISSSLHHICSLKRSGFCQHTFGWQCAVHSVKLHLIPGAWWTQFRLCGLCNYIEYVVLNIYVHIYMYLAGILNCITYMLFVRNFTWIYFGIVNLTPHNIKVYVPLRYKNNVILKKVLGFTPNMLKFP